MESWLSAAVPAFFAIFAATALAALLGARRAARRAASARAVAPDRPWAWRADWARGRADAEGAETPAVAWTAAVLWNAIAAGLAWAALRGGLARDPRLLVVAMFPAAGIGLLAWAIRATLRRKRYGRTFVRLDAVPAPLGGALRGAIVARLPVRRPHRVHLTLSCVNRVTSGTGKSRSTFEHVRWQDDRDVGESELSAGPGGAADVPFSFDLPRDLPPTDGADPANAIRWLLRARTDVPGVDLDDVYEVPVFVTADSPTPEAWAARARTAERAAPLLRPTRPTVGVSPSRGGGTAFEFRAGRNPAAASGATGVAVVVGATAAFLVRQGAPVPLSVAFAAFALLFAAIAVHLWFTRATVVVEGGRLASVSRTLGVRRTRAWSRDDVRAVRCRIGMQTGQGARGVPFYDVVVTDVAGRDAVVGSGLRDRHEAEWIAQEVRRALPLAG